MTIYRLYQENGQRAGFWVQHRTWGNTCAQVKTIGGRDCGPLPGASPQHDGAAVTVRVFDIRSGRRIKENNGMDAGATDSLFCDPTDRHYVRIAEPFWHSRQHEPADGAIELQH